MSELVFHEKKMKIKNIIVEIKPLKDTFKDAMNVMGKIERNEKLAKKDIISFESIEVMRKILTPRRIELLKMIKHKHPGSIYGLAKMVGRDPKSVNTDVVILYRLGILDLDHINEGRETIKPIVDYDKININIAI
ncbi:hypothetical protein CMO89_02715 [Candidatus Woesearchaeota archaeon]|nr:hypothetical protein [Candidatus Woesearchaeota archaeon]|tara:strand:- start:17315 stop:17719 length:405 start_codon:yes stop_codon:yes gene_type:complete